MIPKPEVKNALIHKWVHIAYLDQIQRSWENKKQFTLKQYAQETYNKVYKTLEKINATALQLLIDKATKEEKQEFKTFLQDIIKGKEMKWIELEP